MKKTDVMTAELEIEELENVTGGDTVKFQKYMDYVDSLYTKYNCRGKGMSFLKTVCTAEETARIREMWKSATK